MNKIQQQSQNVIKTTAGSRIQNKTHKMNKQIMAYGSVPNLQVVTETQMI